MTDGKFTMEAIAKAKAKGCFKPCKTPLSSRFAVFARRSKKRNRCGRQV